MTDHTQLRKLLALKDMRRQRCREELANAAAVEERWEKAAVQAERDHRRAERTAATYVQHKITAVPKASGFESAYTSLIAGAVTAHQTKDVLKERSRARKEQSGVATANRRNAAASFGAADASARRFEDMLSRLERIVAAQAELRSEDESAELATLRADHG